MGREVESLREHQIMWRLWAKALGEKSGTDDREANIIAIIRSAIVFTYLITNFVIIAGVIRHWFD